MNIMVRPWSALPSDFLDPLFLSRQRIIEIQRHQIDRYGGLHGIRDNAVPESAVFMPQQTFGGRFVHRDHFEMAAAYAYHISENQPFIDGNKRTGMASSVLFLRINAIEVIADQAEYEALIRRVSVREATKYDISDFLRQSFSPPER